MSAPILTFFNNRGGVGKTSLIYHLAWMYSSMKQTVVVVDLDPQANLTAAFLQEDVIAELWDSQEPGSTIYQCVKPLTGVGDIVPPRLLSISPELFLLPGDVSLSGYEDVLSNQWPNSLNDTHLYRPLKVLTSFWQIMQMASQEVDADLVLVDIGPNLGAINRSVLISTDFVAIPLGADLFSLQGLKNLGPTLRSWKHLWQKRLENWDTSSEKASYPEFELPAGVMEPIGYLCQQHGVRLDRPVQAYDKWVQRIPRVYREHVLDQEMLSSIRQEDDPLCLATIKHYRSLVPMAQEHRKPIFQLTSADGAIGSHANAVQDAKADFRLLAQKIANQIGIALM